MIKLASLLVAGFMCAVPAHVVSAGTLPKTMGYSFFVQGEPAGHADIKVTKTAKAVMFDSKTRVVNNYAVLAYTTHTVADPKTFLVRDFTMEGTKGDDVIRCEAHLHADSAYGYVETNGGLADKRVHMGITPTMVFEDWVVEHDVLMALAQAQAKERTTKYGLLFPSSFNTADITLGFAGDVLVEAGAKSLTARKLVVIIRGAAPYECQVDPKTGLPVYIRFPDSRTEMFLDEIFGENPLTYYGPTDKKQ
ncbi:MAG TPA: hypothetical protein VJS69_08200 [Candidatus Krumholzibacteria bacterium]|nr:hypothetical protein [Candidatus Krumholzibacteria bacterium]